MKKSSYVAMVLGMLSAAVFGLGMCMALKSEWGMFVPGIVVGLIGVALGVVTVLTWRKMEGMDAIQVDVKGIECAGVGVVGALVFGAGMCLVMVWGHVILGAAASVAGVLILMTIPLIRGLR